MRTTRTAVAATAAVAALLTAAGTAAADTASPSTTPSGAPSTAHKAQKAPKFRKAPTGDGARALCKRVPRIDARIDRALARLNGPDTELGSVARLQKRVDNANAAGDTAVATYLKDKLTYRKSLVPTLNQRSTDLDAVRTWCGTQDFTAKGATK
ncbi:hypothetical protein SAMN05216251_101540 [Actinacidiphila alni]|uniref:Uncharacterized protein n=1 Tax=Actinacidiphila alni TaxID=380248 RepID=A0A1I1XU44_9ACTN|nr:hypothetical protein [Actinacidiphila alni]SFE10856.1 hypothetical protein SAMN05216251_101540 [Actinacidiphila alni]